MSNPTAVSEKASWCMNHFDDLFDVLDPVLLGKAILPNLTPIGIDMLYDVMMEAEHDGYIANADPDKSHWSYGGSK
jgi:hypothetical protein